MRNGGAIRRRRCPRDVRGFFVWNVETRNRVSAPREQKAAIDTLRLLLDEVVVLRGGVLCQNSVVSQLAIHRHVSWHAAVPARREATRAIRRAWHVLLGDKVS